MKRIMKRRTMMLIKNLVNKKVLGCIHWDRTNVLSVLNHFQRRKLWRDTKGFTLVRSRSHVLSVLSHFHSRGIWRATREFTLARGCSNVLSALSHFHSREIWRATKEFTPVRSHSNVLFRDRYNPRLRRLAIEERNVPFLKVRKKADILRFPKW